MSVYVDRVRGYYKKGIWAHMVADTSEELEAMARKIGLDPGSIQKRGTHREHYDVRKSKREQAIDAGAVEVSHTQLAAILERKREMA